MNSKSPIESLGHIVMDMHRMTMRTVRADMTDPEDLRNDIGVLSAAVRTLAESVIALHAPVDARSTHPDVTGSGIRSVRGKERA